MVMPKVVKTLKQIEGVYEELEEVDETRLFGYQVEVRVHGNVTIKEYNEIVRRKELPVIVRQLNAPPVQCVQALGLSSGKFHRYLNSINTPQETKKSLSP